ncbi:MAG: nucleotidyl transferase AbiEii/AbiGii toxin family protein [Myxococcales bacterium]|nr:nucleotidyl transferase AbiEii/AbiGii toxin family protein [Myxococcales bacterium]
MTSRIDAPVTQDKLFVWVIHRLAERFENHAILKGGMVLRLLDSTRHTNDLDYVFVPYSSKKDVRTLLVEALEDLEGAQIEVTMHSRMVQVDLSLDGVSVALEASVARSCASSPMTTGAFARSVGQPAQIVRIMDLGISLAHKLGAWNERRLLRDLYDVYFLWTHAGARPTMEVLASRLAKVESRLPKLRNVKSMSFANLAQALQEAANAIDANAIDREMGGLLPVEDLAGLAPRIRSAVVSAAQALRSAGGDER